MSGTVYLVVDRESGLVTNAVVGRAPSDDETLVTRRTGKAADAWIGWTRAADGTYSPPPQPPQPEVPGEAPAPQATT
ncbi:hypothetical protein [Aureimonas sp. SK2]|uniref:hypothetical protein n=1 Tax=Aureimonas sp. SK2 TaxID=3015992 RepID=UPI002444C09E|nr:hypothetical protein [Aureimonas sp. SK2]